MCPEKRAQIRITRNRLFNLVEKRMWGVVKGRKAMRTNSTTLGPCRRSLGTGLIPPPAVLSPCSCTGMSCSPYPESSGRLSLQRNSCSHSLKPTFGVCSSGLLSPGMCTTRPESGLGVAICLGCGQNPDMQTGMPTCLCTQILAECAKLKVKKKSGVGWDQSQLSQHHHVSVWNWRITEFRIQTWPFRLSWRCIRQDRRIKFTLYYNF